MESTAALENVLPLVQPFASTVEEAADQFDFFNYPIKELRALLKDKFDAPNFRAVQMFEWVYRKGVFDINQMTNISRSLRNELASRFYFPEAKIVNRQISSDGTRKYVVEVGEGDLVESVMIKQPKRMTLCVSSQVGCGMACSFCRTGTMGLKRSLSVSEILQQVLLVLKDAKNFGDTFQNIVFMGMGEPLHNFKGVTGAVRVLTDPHGFGMSPRKITVSTVGLVPAIKKLAEASVPVSLAVSLNATTDEIRSQIMPVNQRFPISELLGAIKEFPLGRRKKVTIEYVMLSGLNDTKEDLSRLSKMMKGLPVKVNLIPYNENAGLGYRSPKNEWVHEWQKSLNSHGVQATIRWSKGSDINAACGQLATTSSRKSG